MHNTMKNPEDLNKLLEVKFYVIPRYDSERDMSFPHDKRFGNPIPIDQITNRLEINTRYGDIEEELGGKSLLDSCDIEGSVRLLINGKLILDIDQTTYDLVSAVGIMSQKISHLNLELIKMRKGERSEEDLVWNGSNSLMHIRYSYAIPKDKQNMLIFAYESNNRRGEEVLDRIKFSQLFLLEFKRFFEKIAVIFPEELDTYLRDLEEINFVRGYLLCEELNRQS